MIEIPKLSDEIRTSLPPEAHAYLTVLERVKTELQSQVETLQTQVKELQVHTVNNQTKKQVTEPALFIIAQNTLPLVTTVMFAFTAAMIGIVATRNTPGFQDNSSLILLVVAALLFLFASEACAKSLAWDYYSLSEERRKADNLSDAEIYIKYCARQSEFWFKIAVWTYRIGLGVVLFGVAVLLWPISYIASAALVIVSLILEVLLRRLSPR
ncbi:MAG: hypothetical protein L6R45_33820 [Anaerolineae bacterium]|nr:hypothetical protein [Anaerolineae bacterium]